MLTKLKTVKLPAKRYLMVAMAGFFLVASFSIFAPRKADAQVAGWRLEECRNWTRWTRSSFKMGDRGGCVYTIQHFLNEWRFFNRMSGITYDGVYGGQTRDAVVFFQLVNGLGIDGKAGPQTLGKMSSVCES